MNCARALFVQFIAPHRRRSVARNMDKLPAKQARLVPWDEVHVDCIGPWTITASDGAEYEFNALTCIDPVTNLVDIIRLNGSNPKAGYCGQRFEICWLS